MKVLSAQKTILLIDESNRLSTYCNSINTRYDKEVFNFGDTATFKDFLAAQTDTSFPLILLHTDTDLKLLKAIKTHKDYEQTPIVLFLSERLSHLALEAYDLGANAVVIAPTENRQLQNAIEHTMAFWAGINLTTALH